MTRVMQAIRTVDSRQTGGPEELLLSCCPLMRERGRFEPTILLLRKPNPQVDPAKDFGDRARKLSLSVLPLQDMRWQPRWLRSLPHRLGASLIHVHGQRANYFVWLMRRLFPRTWGKVPLVATVHGWVQDNTLRRAVTRLEWGTLRECDHIITVTELQRQTLLGMGLQPDKESVLRPGIPATPAPCESGDMARLRAEARQRWGLPQDAFVVSAIGRLSTEKRFDLYLEACAELSKQLPDSYFLLVGGGKQDANLRALSAQSSLGGRLVFTGLTREMPLVYAATDLLMITSDTEGIPHVLLEAMTRGIPVVSTAVGGIPEIATNEQSALLVPPGDRQALVQAARRIHDDPSLAARLASGGRSVSEHFTLDRLVEGMEDVYRQVLEKHPAGRRR